jgi:hypothetical protein
MGLEVALLGTAASAAAGTAATAGLIGTGGTLFGISGLTASALSTGFSVLSGLSSFMGGMQAKGESKIQAANAKADAAKRGAEEARLAAREADLTQQEADSIRKRQKVAYLKSGVSLSGSPLLVMEETRRKGKENVNEILTAGQYASQSAYQEGRTQARAYKSAGRQAFVNGLTNAGSAFARMA